MEFPKFRFILMNFSQVYRVFVGARCIGIVRNFRDHAARRFYWRSELQDGTTVLNNIVDRRRAAEVLWEYDQTRT